ncbi:MAG: 50S ribosomal protein L21e [Nanoarchaeota archaeon]|nr:50S ribosomal protein L21e [Nanoarchaeota archaeon]
MVVRSHGFRIGTRRKLRKKIREKGKISIRKALQKFEIGDKVVIDVEPAYHKAMPYKRFFGKHGVVIEQRGKSYVVEVKDGRKTKQIICAPIHLKKI